MLKKLLYILPLLLIFLLANISFTEANSFREVKKVNGSQLVVKASSSTSAKTIATLKRNDFVTVFSTSNGWSYIQAGQTKGYVNSSFLTTPPSTIKIASSKSGLVVKDTATKSSKTVATLKYNMIVEDFGSVGGGWSFVQYGNVTGYVATSFIGTAKTTTKSVHSTSSVNIRNIASPSGAIKSTLAANTKVTVHSTLVGWSYVSSGSVRGYVEAKYLVNTPVATAQSATDYAPKCGKTYLYRFGWNDYVSMECEKSGSVDYWEGQLNEFSHFYVTEVKNNQLIYHYVDHSFVYQFPMTAGKTWTQYDIYSTKVYYVMSTNEILTIEDSFSGTNSTYRNVIKIRITYNDGYVYYVYLAKDIGVIYEYNQENYISLKFLNAM